MNEIKADNNKFTMEDMQQLDSKDDVHQNGSNNENVNKAAGDSEKEHKLSGTIQFTLLKKLKKDIFPGAESLSWWRRTTSLPSSLHKKKNIWFQVFNIILRKMEVLQD